MSANVSMPRLSSGRSAPTNAAAAATTCSLARFMLPLESSTSTIDTGDVASWKVSTFCSTPSSNTARSSRAMSRYWLRVSIAVNSSTARTGGGFGAR